MPNEIGYIDDDIITTYSQANKSSRKRMQLAFGDKVEIVEYKSGWTKLNVLDSYNDNIRFINGKVKLRKKGLLKFSMVDVQQGDGMILESPSGKIIFIDGGDNKLFARHATARFQCKNTSASKRLDIDAIVVTHGDADHFKGLNEIVNSEKHKTKRKQLFIKPLRIYHNGLLKAPGSKNGKRQADLKLLGTTALKNGKKHAISLYDDTRDAAKGKANRPFSSWHKSLDHWEKETNQKIECRRLEYGMNEDQLFDFLKNDNIKVELLGPFTEEVTYRNKKRRALPFLHTHKDVPAIHVSSTGEHGEYSAGHTINGHSIAFRLTYGNVRFLFTGDLNKESLDRLLQKVGDKTKLECEIFKAPHHGSHDFAFKAIQAAKPLVSIISSGDENAMKEYIHPRATLMSALGRATRSDLGLLLNTELAAFFDYENVCVNRDNMVKYFNEKPNKQYKGSDLATMFKSGGVLRKLKSFHGFKRTNFGIIHIRTDGKRLLVFTH